MPREPIFASSYAGKYMSQGMDAATGHRKDCLKLISPSDTELGRRRASSMKYQPEQFTAMHSKNFW